MSNQAIKDAKRKRRTEARQSIFHDLHGQDLDLKRIAAREVGLVLYAQDVSSNPQHPELVHILSNPNEMPRPENLAMPDANAKWFEISDRSSRLVDRLAPGNGVRIRTDEHGRMVAEAA